MQNIIFQSWINWSECEQAPSSVVDEAMFFACMHVCANIIIMMIHILYISMEICTACSCGTECRIEANVQEVSCRNRQGGVRQDYSKIALLRKSMTEPARLENWGDIHNIPTAISFGTSRYTTR